MYHSLCWRLKRKLKEERETQAHSGEPAWWQSWEFYLLVLLAVVLRLYRIDTAQYMTDQNTFYQMAHDALAHGLWPISANNASVGALIPPLFVYVMMIPAVFTSNPVAGNILIALFNVAAVLLTYMFARRYYGRLAGAISALLYATAVNVIIFSRDIWQPDLLPLFVILLLFMLFRGVVEGKRYWFLPSALLIGAMYQFHSTAIYLLVPLLVAMVLAYKTIRWRELPLAVAGNGPAYDASSGRCRSLYSLPDLSVARPLHLDRASAGSCREAGAVAVARAGANHPLCTLYGSGPDRDSANGGERWLAGRSCPGKFLEQLRHARIL